MKVVHVGFNHRSNDIRIFYKECMSLNNHGHEVFYVTSDKNAGTVNVNQDIKVTVIPLHKTNRLKRFWKFCNELKKTLCLLDADVYHFHEDMLLPVLLYMKRRGKRVIYDVHEDYPPPFFRRRFGKFLGDMLAGLFGAYEELCMKRADCVIAATQHIEQRCKKITPKVSLVANYPLFHDRSGINTPFVKREKIVCYTGGLAEINGIFQMTEAMEQIHGILYLAGNLSENLKNELVKYSGWNKVKELGYISQEEVQNVLSKSRVGFVVYMPSSGTIAALPNKMFEYMEAGLPIVVSNFPLWKEIIEKNQCGICVAPDNPTEIANAVNHILENPKLAEKMGENGKKAVREKYNWQTEEKKLLRVYEKLIFD